MDRVLSTHLAWFVVNGVAILFFAIAPARIMRVLNFGLPIPDDRRVHMRVVQALAWLIALGLSSAIVSHLFGWHRL